MGEKKSIAVFPAHCGRRGQNPRQTGERSAFHEVGAVDSIGGLSWARASGWNCSANRACWRLRRGRHGLDSLCARTFSIPAPATLGNLRRAKDSGFAMRRAERTHPTPTGAALLAEFAESFAPMSSMAAEKIGFGLGTRENKTRPNVVRAVLERSPKSPVQSPGRLTHTSHLAPRTSDGKPITSRCWKRIWTMSAARFWAHS